MKAVNVNHLSTVALDASGALVGEALEHINYFQKVNNRCLFQSVVRQSSQAGAWLYWIALQDIIRTYKSVLRQPSV